MIIMKFCFLIIIFDVAALPKEPKNNSRKAEIEIKSAAKKFSRGKHNLRNHRRVLTLDEIYRYLRKISASDDAVSLLEIGKSYSGLPIYAVKIHKDGFPTISTMVVEFGTHPREWVSPASAMYLIKRLLQKRGRLIEVVQWYLIPVLNPDGYNYSIHSDNMWRKNLHPLGEGCTGVDLNRNFGVAWDTGRSRDECSERFAGYEPFSEPESLTVRNLVESIGPEFIDAYVAVHSCAQSILYPYGYKEESPALKILRRLKQAGKKMANKMYKVRGKRYPVKQAASLSGISGGGSDDFMFEHYHVPLVYTLELGDYPVSENYDTCFHPGPKRRAAITKECYAGLTALAEYDLHYKRKKIKSRMAPISATNRISAAPRKLAFSVFPTVLPLFY